jgi:hypothetical protein
MQARSVEEQTEREQKRSRQEGVSNPVSDISDKDLTSLEPVPGPCHCKVIGIEYLASTTKNNIESAIRSICAYANPITVLHYLCSPLIGNIKLATVEV